METAYLFNCRSLQGSCFSAGLWSNPWALGGAVAMVAGQVLFTYAPFMNQWFHSTPITAASWLRIIVVATFTFTAVEFEKWIRGRRHGKMHGLVVDSPS